MGFNPYFRHLLDQFTRHRTDVGTTVAADFRFVTYATQRHTDIFTSGRFRNGLTQRGFTYRRSNQTEDWAFQFVYTALYREVLKDAVFNTLRAVVVGIRDLLRLTQVFLTLLRAFHGT